MTTTLTLSIEKMVAGGFGLARDQHGVVLVRGALPEEVVQASVQKVKGVRQGTVLKIVQASPERISSTPDTPTLPNLSDLPTADLAHATYAAQLSYKRGFVTEALSRIAKCPAAKADELTHPTVPSPQEWAYRNIAQYLVTPHGFAYRKRGGHEPTTITQDPLVMPAIQHLLSTLDPAELVPAHELVLRTSHLTGEVVAALIGEGSPRQFLRASDALLDAGVVGISVARQAAKRFSAGVKLIAGESEIWEAFGAIQATINATGFAQINPPAAGLAYQKAAEFAGQGQHLLDLYGGNGAIGRHALPHFGRVTIVDTSREALERGRQNVEYLASMAQEEAQEFAADNLHESLQTISFQRGDASLLTQLGADVVIVDPPRAGLDKFARYEIQHSSVRRLVYVSCNPATWARDIAGFVGEDWCLLEVHPHDFYPQTSHVELVSVLER